MSAAELTQADLDALTWIAVGCRGEPVPSAAQRARLRRRGLAMCHPRELPRWRLTEAGSAAILAAERQRRERLGTVEVPTWALEVVLRRVRFRGGAVDALNEALRRRLEEAG